ncbi:MAG: UvrD-helicase domain-containing protein [Gammaproteobacteria bacterium]|nr:UvrD-helicase domain-containing protein [Gammaproteobacteria bacterium]MDE2346306.1 UvrD-helicase domain-containing protein [Gammaproteobacteria bacterium]
MAVNEQPPADAAERARALDARESFIVQAPAGSGKTELLTQRFLTLLAVVDEPEEILAITFTRKAAGEMRMRVVQALELADNAAPRETHKRHTWELAQRARARDRQRGWRLASHPARLRIQTIDSLNAELTRRMPLLSKFGAQPGIAEKPRALYQEAARRTLDALEEGDPQQARAVSDLLLHLDNDLPRVLRLMADLLPRRDQWLRHTGTQTGDERRADLEQALQAELRMVLAQVLAAIPEDCRMHLVELAAKAAARLHQQDSNSEIVVCLEMAALPGTEARDIPAWRGIAELFLTKEGAWRKQINARQGFPPDSGGDKTRVQELLRRFSATQSLGNRLAYVRELPLEPRYPDAQWQVLAALLNLLPQAAAQLQLVFMEHGEVDYAEVALRALQALGTPEAPTDLTLTLDYRLRHILVDEFQDTSVNQIELLKRLTAGWEPGDGRSLFLVGDPMQSIYRFREAEVGLYLRVRQQGLQQLQLSPLTLQANFRSQAGLVHWFNQTFQTIFPQREDIPSGAVRYASASPQHPELQHPAVCVHPQLQWDIQQEADEIASLIAETRTQHPQASIAVLARVRAHLAGIVRRLRALNIPLRAVELEYLGERPVVQDLFALTRALLHAGDRTAWLAVLRAPWCGLSLEALHALAGSGHSQTIAERLRDEQCMRTLQPLAAGTRFSAVRPVLLDALAHQRRGSLRQQVERTWLALGGPASLRVAADLEDAEAYLELLETLDDGGELEDAAGLQAALEDLFARPDPRAGESLQLMTMHKSKGLEFDLVILPGLGAGSRRDDKPLLSWLERPRPDGRNDLLLAPLEPKGADQDPLYQLILTLKREQQQLELTRLLYVAATRARQRLHLFGHALVREHNGVRMLAEPRKNSLLRLLWPMVRGDFAAALQSQASVPATREKPSNSTQLSRLRPDWQMQPANAAVGLPAAAQTLAAEETALEFEWVGDTLRHVGTVVHRLLQRMAADGAESWDAARVKQLGPLVNHWLREAGVGEAELEAAAADVQQALTSMLADPRGRWLLDSKHAEAHSEYALSHFDGARLASSVIDRTFVDRDGIRWIVDYKTSRHRGGDVEEFLAREQLRYQGQLENYARLMRGLEQRRVKVGLYFPLLRRFVEWEPEDG